MTAPLVVTTRFACGKPCRALLQPAAGEAPVGRLRRQFWPTYAAGRMSNTVAMPFFAAFVQAGVCRRRQTTRSVRLRRLGARQRKARAAQRGETGPWVHAEVMPHHVDAVDRFFEACSSPRSKAWTGLWPAPPPRPAAARVDLGRALGRASPPCPCHATCGRGHEIAVLCPDDDD